MRDKSIPLQEGIQQGFDAVVGAAYQQQKHISPYYLDQLKQSMPMSDLSGSFSMNSVLSCDTQPVGLMHDNVPIDTYSKYNMSMDPRVLVSNNQPIKQDEYSVVAQMFKQTPFYAVDINPKTVEDMTGGIVANGRGQMFVAGGVPAETIPDGQERMINLEGNLTKKDIQPLNETVRQAKREYIKGLYNMGTKYGLDVATLPISPIVGVPNHVRGASQGVDVPVLDSKGNRIGQVKVPEAAAHQAYPTPTYCPVDATYGFGYAVRDADALSPLPIVATQEYTGLSSYVQPSIEMAISGSMGHDRRGRHASHKPNQTGEHNRDKSLRREMLQDKSLFDQYINACTRPQSLQQKLVLGASIALLAIVLCLLIWGLVALARTRHTHAAKPMGKIVPAPIVYEPAEEGEMSWQTRPNVRVPNIPRMFE